MATTGKTLPTTAAPGPAELLAGAGDAAVSGRLARASGLAVLRVSLDVLATALAASLAFPLRFRWHLLEATPAPLDAAAHLAAGALWVVAVVGAMASHRLHDEDTLRPGGREAARVARSLLEGVGVVSTAVFLLRFVTVSRGWFALTVVLTIVLLAAERRGLAGLLARLWARGRLRRPAIMVVSGEPAPSDDGGFDEFDVVATISADEFSSLLSATPQPARGGAPVVIVDAPGLAHDDLWRLALQAGDAGCPVFLRSPFRPLPADRLTTRTLGTRTIVKLSPPALHGLRALEKRVLDLVLAILALCLLAIPMTLVALTVLLISGRPVFYGQQRVGKDGRLFPMWKFRTMRVDAEAQSGPVWARPGDPRRTPLGRVLRRLSVDELPQLWNVLCGHMSIVGPRPERPLFVARFSDDDPWYRFRHRIRPGITGLAQVRGLRGDTPLGPRVESDNWYIEHWSMWLDLRIAAATFFEVLRGRNAF